MQDQKAELKRFGSISNPSTSGSDAKQPETNAKLVGQLSNLSFSQRQDIIRTSAALRRTSAAGLFKASGQVPSEAHHLPPGAWQQVELELQKTGLTDDAGRNEQVSSELEQVCNESVQEQQQQQSGMQQQPHNGMQERQQQNGIQQHGMPQPGSLHGNGSHGHMQDSMTNVPRAHSLEHMTRQQDGAAQQHNQQQAGDAMQPARLEQIHQQAEQAEAGMPQHLAPGWDDEVQTAGQGVNAAGLKGGAAEELRGLARLEENALEAKVLGPIGKDLPGTSPCVAACCSTVAMVCCAADRDVSGFHQPFVGHGCEVTWRGKQELAKFAVCRLGCLALEHTTLKCTLPQTSGAHLRHPSALIDNCGGD